MSKNKHNDHFVPQHFLRAWAFDEEKNKLYRYKWIKNQNKVEFGSQSIVSSASEKNLYEISDLKSTIEFESTVMTSLVDTPLSPVIKKIRESGLSELSIYEKTDLARYIVIMEGRNPATIKKMQISESDLDQIFAEISDEVSSPSVKQEVHSFMRELLATSGKLASGIYAGWGHRKDASKILEQEWIEVTAPLGISFVSSNYPVGNTGDYDDENFLLSISLSPQKALLCIPKNNVHLRDQFLNGPQNEICRFINLQTISMADEAYSEKSLKDPFLEKHLGWKLKTKDGHKEYFISAMAAPYRRV